VEDDGLEAEVQALAGGLAASATGALGRARRLLLDSFESSLETQMEIESRSIVEAIRSPHGREGMHAFVAKRRPDFS
jgi:2-(1,2-epoxy-1,2-dihydrophenyl)acetyl-CoA isomerase